MKATTLREQTKENLEKELTSLREEQFKLRMQKPTGQLRKTHLIRANRRTIARVQTLLNEKN